MVLCLRRQTVVQADVDSEDLPPNTLRVTLQPNKFLRVISKIWSKIVSKCWTFTETAEKNDDYKKIYQVFGKCLKLGVHQASTDRTKVHEFMRYQTLKFSSLFMESLRELLNFSLAFHQACSRAILIHDRMQRGGTDFEAAHLPLLRFYWPFIMLVLVPFVFMIACSEAALTLGQRVPATSQKPSSQQSLHLEFSLAFQACSRAILIHDPMQRGGMDFEAAELLKVSLAFHHEFSRAVLLHDRMQRSGIDFEAAELLKFSLAFRHACSSAIRFHDRMQRGGIDYEVAELLNFSSKSGAHAGPFFLR